MPTQTRNKPVLFVSRVRNQRLIRDRRDGEDKSGRLTPKGVVYEFENGRYEIVAGKDKLPDGPADYDVDPDQPTVQDGLTWLRNHDKFGTEFWEVTETPEDNTSELLSTIAEAAAGWDMPALEEILQGERDGAQRPVVIQVATDALARVRENDQKLSELEKKK